MAAKQVYVVVPTTTRVDSNGNRDFQLLTFALPQWTFVSAQPAGKGLDTPPTLLRDVSGAVRAVSEKERMPVTEVDVRGYKGPATLGNQILESSGSISLLSLFTGEPERDRLQLGLADRSARTLAPLRELPLTTVFNVHLAPGGGFLLVEVATPTAPAGMRLPRTGELRLYDATGSLVANLTDDSIRELNFLALTRTGLAIYYNGTGTFRFVRIAPKDCRFGSDVVSQPFPNPIPGLVFAGQ